MEKDQLSRKLAVILHADVVDSTTLVRLDETLAHERIQDVFQRFSETIAQHNGIAHEIRGDALVAEFARASDAVSAAVDFQSTNATEIESLQDEVRPVVRVGIAMGEVVVADNTVTGEGIVMAQRLEQFAEPGGVCIQGAVYQTMPKRLPFEYEDLGEHELKGFDDPVRIYQVGLSTGESIPLPQPSSQPKKSHKRLAPTVALAAGVIALLIGVAYLFLSPEVTEDPASPDRIAFPLPDKPSIAVLPFTNMSDDAQQEYFVDGMTEDLITDISKIPELFVIARNSVFTYKGKAVKVRQVAEELGVRYVLEGSVRRSGEQVRINAQLIDATTGGHLWADRYDGSIADVFALTDTVTQQIVNALQLQLARIETTDTSNIVNRAAYDAFLKGWAHYQRHSMRDSIDAVPHLQQAVQIDPDYAEAHAALAAVYWEILQNDWTGDLGKTRADVMANLEIHLDNAKKQPSTLAYWVASNLLISEGKYEAAVTEARKIVSLDSNNADGYALLAKALELTGKSDESSRLIEKAQRLNPHVSQLHAAVKKGNKDDVKRLIAEGANVNLEDYYGNTPLHIAAFNGQVEISVLLVEASADLEAGARGYPDNRYLDSTPLMVAAQKGQAKIAKVLIDAGADVNAKNNTVVGSKFSAIQWAAFDGHTEIVRLLLASGVDLNAKGGRRLETPLIMAAQKGHTGTVELLISEGADINSRDFFGKTPLHQAAIAGNSELVRLLLENGADINARTTSGNFIDETPLHAAALAGHEDIAELLLASGGDVNATGQHYYTPLRRAVDGGHMTVVKLLIENGGDVESKDVNGVTLLHIIARTENVEIAELLISKGADVNAKDKNLGFTPLDYAQGGASVMIELLERHGSVCTSC